MTGPGDGNQTVTAASDPAVGEMFVIDSLDADYVELKKRMSQKPPPHPDETRDKIINRLLIGVLILIGLPLITYLAFPGAIQDKVLEYTKWGVSVILPLFGTAIGFYFGGKSKGEKENPDG